MKRAKIRKILALACVAVLSGVLLSGCNSNIELSSGKFPVDAESITTVVQAEDLALLDGFTALRQADFSGSTCYDKIAKWAQAHPEVDTLYTIALPTGETVDNSVASLDMSSCAKDDVFAAAEFFKYLPALKELKVGSALAADELVTLAGEYPGLKLDFSCTIGNQKLDPSTSAVDLTGWGDEEAAELLLLLPSLKNINSVELGDDTVTSISWENIAAICGACPNADVNYAFTLYGKHFTLDSTSMIISHKPIDDNGALVKLVLACMPKLTYLDMDSCGVGDEDMAAIRDAFPNVKVVWRVWFGNIYSVRTDVTKILASSPMYIINDENSVPLKYCTDVKYLDLGHNPEMKDISFVSYMPDLEVAILAMVATTDFSPLADCPHLEYLELGASGLHDLTPFANLKELRHLSICADPCIYDISPLYGLTELERLWIGPWVPVPQEQIDKMQQCAPECYIDMYSQYNGDYTPGHPGWRRIGTYESGGAKLHPRYVLLWDQFGYGDAPYSYAYPANDPLYYKSSEP